MLTLLTLSVAGANFMTAMNVGASIDKSIKRKLDTMPYDIEIAFSRSYQSGEIEQIISQVDGWHLAGIHGFNRICSFHNYAANLF